jgi:beta-aspartyl-peptidase (threonine type)
MVHGGAWNIPAELEADCRAGCARALQTGWQILAQGGSAIDAVEAAIVVLEEDPVFDAGVGSHLNADGVVQMDAILMDGETLNAGAVAAVEHIRNPIRAARCILEKGPHILLAGTGAERFAAACGIPLCEPSELIVPREKQRWEALRKQGQLRTTPERPGSTVGAVARDAQGRIAAGTSTGGTFGKHPGRIGDSPLVGCGCYADSESAAASATGWGESIMKIVMAKMAVDLVRAGLSPAAAALRSVHRLAERVQGSGGLILLDRLGRIGAAFNTPHMVYGYVAADGSLVVHT